LGHEVSIEHLDNPRTEKEEHYYNAVNTKLLDLGLEPHYLGEELVQSVLGTIDRFKGRVITTAIKPRTRWKPLVEPQVLTQHEEPPLKRGRFERGEGDVPAGDGPLSSGDAA
jgi:hypothetical protein